MGYLINARSSAIAMFIDYFNTASIIALALFALLGVIAIFSKELRAGAPALSAFAVAALAAFALEATAFNFVHYLKYFAGPQIGITGVLESNPNVLLTTDGTKAEMIEGGRGIRFKNLNKKVTSVFINMSFDDIEMAEMLVKWTDESITNQYTKRLYKYLPHENYAPLQPCGKVSELTVMFNSFVESSSEITEVVINKPIPFYFSGLRLSVVSLLIFAIFAIVNKGLRAKAAYYLFEYKFDPKSKKQNFVYACMVTLLILLSWGCVYTSVGGRHESDLRFSQYNRFLVDALIAGRTYLEYGNPQRLLNAERPYDPAWREANGYKEMDKEAFDWGWYKGKYYCYFGVVPAVLLYVPYKMITGNYLSNHAGVFLFCVIAVILLAVLWRCCVKKYMRDTRYALYLLSFAALFFASCLFVVLRYPTFYCIVQSAGFMFTVAGALLLLKSVENEKINQPSLFFACLCFALVFGCRPNMGLASLLVPVVLWRYRTWKLFAFAMLPYIIVAIPLCLYNYARYGSIFDFGVDNVLGAFWLKPFAQRNILGKIFITIVSSAHYLFCPGQFSMSFPFVNLSPGDGMQITRGVLWNFRNAIGIINFPIVFCLFYMLKNFFVKDKPKPFYVLASSLISAAAIVVLNSFIQGCHARYMLDIAIFIVFPSLFCAYYWCQAVEKNIMRGGVAPDLFIGRKIRLGATYALIIASIFVGLFLCVSAEATYSNPTLYRYLEYSLGFFRNV